jgi:uncharacterized protein YecT (DUF1311 family)
MMKSNWNTARAASNRPCATAALLLLVVCGWLPLIGMGSDSPDETAPLTAEDIRCQTNQDTLNECAERKLHRAEARMKTAFEAVLAKVRGTRSEPLLRESQDLWLKFREADCRYFISGLTPDGSMVEQVRNDCRTRRTEQRTLQLKEMNKCVAAGCPGQQ